MLELHLPVRQKSLADITQSMSLPDKMFDVYKVGSNKTSPYVPYYSLFHREHMPRTKDTYVYYKPTFFSPTHASQYDDMYTILESYGRTSGVFSFTIGGSSHKIFITNGALFDAEHKVLMMLTMKDYYEWENTTKFRLYISTELITNPIYKNLWKKLNTEYVAAAYEKEIEVLISSTTKIESMIYNAKPEIRYDNLDELTGLLQNMNNYLNPELFLQNKIMTGFNNDVVNPLTEGLSARNILFTDLRNGEPVPALTKDLVEGDVIDMETTDWLAFEQFFERVYSQNVGAARKFSARCENFSTDRMYFTFSPVTNVLICETNRRDYLMQVVDYDVVARYESELANVQENVNFVEEDVESEDPF